MFQHTSAAFSRNEISVSAASFAHIYDGCQPTDDADFPARSQAPSVRQHCIARSCYHEPFNLLSRIFAARVDLLIFPSLSQGVDGQTRSESRHFRDLNPDSVLMVLNAVSHRASRGDRKALSALFDLSSKSEGYVSEALGTVLGNLLLKKTNFFLRSLSVRPAEERKHIALMAFDMDGGGMPEADRQSINTTLKGLASGKDSRMSKAAKSCLQALDLARRQPKQ
jgi:hypothetical protein